MEPFPFRHGVHQGCLLLGQPYTVALKPFLCLLSKRMMGLVLREPVMRVVFLTHANNILLTVQAPSDLTQVEACQSICLVASSA